jgi:tetratricopeptide (TPR) repeat protein
VNRHPPWRDCIRIAAVRSVEDAMEDARFQFAGRYVSAMVAALALIGGGFVPAAPITSEQALEWCNGDGHTTPDRMIAGCTALIKSGEFSGRDLAIAFTNRGSAYDDKHDEDRAIADHDSAIRIDPELELAFNNRGNAWGRKGEPDRAIADYDEAIRLNPKFFMAWINRGKTFREDKHDYVRAISDYDEAIRINPRFADAYNSRAIAYHNLGKPDLALQDYDSAIRFDPKFALAYHNRGREYLDKAEYDTAIADFGKALAIDPGYVNAYWNRGNAWFGKADYARAISDYTAALAINDGDSDVYLARAMAYDRNGDLDSALADYDKVLAVKPQDTATLARRGYAHFDRGDFADAAADLAGAAATNPYPYPSLIRFLALARAGQATPDLQPAMLRLNSRDWPYAVFELFLGRSDPAATLAAAQKPEERCEAQFYVGEWQLLKGDRAAARPHIEEAAGSCPKTFIEYTAAQAEVRRLGP